MSYNLIVEDPPTVRSSFNPEATQIYALLTPPLLAKMALNGLKYPKIDNFWGLSMGVCPHWEVFQLITAMHSNQLLSPYCNVYSDWHRNLNTTQQIPCSFDLSTYGIHWSPQSNVRRTVQPLNLSQENHYVLFFEVGI